MENSTFTFDPIKLKPNEPLSFSGELPGEVYNLRSELDLSSVRVELTLIMLEEDESINVFGSVSYSLSGKCDLCLAPAKTEIEQSFNENFYLKGSETLDEMAYWYTLHHLDLLPMLRDVIVNAYPTMLTCKEDCKGLCLTCAADLNKTQCNCSNTETINTNRTANPFDILKQLGGDIDGSTKKKN